MIKKLIVEVHYFDEKDLPVQSSHGAFIVKSNEAKERLGGYIAERIDVEIERLNEL